MYRGKEASGASVLKRVALGHSIANGPVPGPLRDMEKNHARGKTSSIGAATQNNALVDIEIFRQTSPICHSSARALEWEELKQFKAWV